MKTTLSFISFVLIAMMFTSCAKSSDENTGGNSVDSSYQPSSAGSSWLYYTRDTIGTLTDSILVTSTGRDTTLAGNTYKILNYDTTMQFQYHSGNQYKLRTSAYSFATTLGNISVSGVNIIHINNENDPVGTNWTFNFVDGGTITVSGFPVQTKAVAKVLNTGITDVENGVTYNKVFVSHIDFQAILPSFPPTTTYSNVQGMDIYSAKGVGIIKIITYDQNGLKSTIQSLKRYTIK